MAAYEKLLSYANDLTEKAKSAKDVQTQLKPEGRIMGKVFFSPAVKVHPGRGQLRDWALLKLEESQFKDCPDNRVYIGGSGLNDGNSLRFCYPVENEERLQVDEKGFINISDVRPYVSGPRKPFPVAKRGRTPGLTFGVVCEIEAVIRQPTLSGDEQISWSLPVIGYWKTISAFSAEGDSGACIFDFSGRAVAILDGGKVAGRLENSIIRER